MYALVQYVSKYTYLKGSFAYASVHNAYQALSYITYYHINYGIQASCVSYQLTFIIVIVNNELGSYISKLCRIIYDHFSVLTHKRKLQSSFELVIVRIYIRKA